MARNPLDSDSNVKALIEELGLYEWDLTQSVADLIDPAELMRSFHDCINREKLPLIERLRLTML